VDEFVRLTIFGLVSASIYFVAASGLVLTYTTSGIFNFAHGAIGMVAAFVYWELRFNPDGPGLPTPVALVLVLGVIAPLAGVLLERFLFRNLHGASLAAQLVVTVGLLAGLIGLAQTIWPPESRIVTGFFDPDGIDVLGVLVTWHRAITVLVAVGVAVGLRLLLYRSRIGIAMRAVVDNPDLAGINGAYSHRVSSFSWALGCSLAALSGILLAPVLSLEAIGLTLLVVTAYAAAMVGRLQNLPLTLLGAVILGLGVQYEPSYLPDLFGRFHDWWPGVFKEDGIPSYLDGLEGSLPTVMLFIVLLLLPQAKLEGFQARAGRRVRVPGLRQSAIAAGALVASAVVLTGLLADRDLRRVGEGLALGLIVLSLVPLTGYAGQVSLCQLMFAGIGAWLMSDVAKGGSPVGLLAVVVITAAVGALIALPALRLQGLYLALSTLAVAVLADNMFFPREEVFFAGTTTVPRLDLGFIDFQSTQSYFILLAVAYGLMGMFVLALRRGEYGRRLAAMKDSQAACATLGLNLTTTKLSVFALSAAMAGLGGALYGGLRVGVQSSTFNFVAGLPILLLAVIGGIATVSGALVGGFFFALVNILSIEFESIDWLVLVAPGFVGLTLGTNPDGAVPQISERVRGLLARRRGEVPREEVERKERRRSLRDIGPELPLGGRLSAEQARALDEALGTEEVTTVGAPRG